MKHLISTLLMITACSQPGSQTLLFDTVKHPDSTHRLIRGEVGKYIFITYLAIYSEQVNEFSLESGTGIECHTNTQHMLGAYGSIELATNGGFKMARDIPFLMTMAPGDDLCLYQKELTGLQGRIDYSIRKEYIITVQQ